MGKKKKSNKLRSTETEEHKSEKAAAAGDPQEFWSRLLSIKGIEDLEEARKEWERDDLQLEDLEIIKDIKQSSDALGRWEGMGLTPEEVDALAQERHTTFEDYNLEDAEDNAKMISSLMYLICIEGIMPKDALQCTPEMLESIYAQGYTNYNAGKSEEAERIFKFLVFLDSGQFKYHLGVAAALHQMKKYEDAAQAYITATLIDETNPMPHYHASDCYLELNDPESAQQSLGYALEVCGDEPKWQDLKKQVILMKKTIADKLKKIPKDKMPKSKVKDTEFLRNAEKFLASDMAPNIEDLVKDTEKNLGDIEKAKATGPEVEG